MSFFEDAEIDESQARSYNYAQNADELDAVEPVPAAPFGVPNGDIWAQPQMPGHSGPFPPPGNAGGMPMGPGGAGMPSYPMMMPYYGFPSPMMPWMGYPMPFPGAPGVPPSSGMIPGSQVPPQMPPQVPQIPQVPQMAQGAPQPLAPGVRENVQLPSFPQAAATTNTQVPAQLAPQTPTQPPTSQNPQVELQVDSQSYSKASEGASLPAQEAASAVSAENNAKQSRINDKKSQRKRGDKRTPPRDKESEPLIDGLTLDGSQLAKPVTAGYSLTRLAGTSAGSISQARSDLLLKQHESPRRSSQQSQSPAHAFSQPHSRRYPAAHSNARSPMSRRDRDWYNGMMGERDRNFVMRVQLEQLVSSDPLADDFYYQVRTSLQHDSVERTAAKEQEAERVRELANSYMRRRQRRSGGDKLQQMQQQVADTVERVNTRARERAEKAAEAAAALKEQLETGKGAEKGAESSAEDKPKRLRTRGTAVRPRLALDLTDALDTSVSATIPDVYTDIQVLRQLEVAFDAVLEVEAHIRERPPPEDESASAWAAGMGERVDALWESLQVLAPVDKEGQHPLVLMLGHAKGKKLVPRAFPFLDPKRRLTILTRLCLHIGDWDVIRHPENLAAVDLFSHTVHPPLAHLISESDYATVVGVVALIGDNKSTQQVARCRVGQSLLVVLISRAEMLQEERPAEEQAMWQQTFGDLFAKLEPVLPQLFSTESTSAEAWHFLASLALPLNDLNDLDRQRVLLDAVRERIFGTMTEANATQDAAKIADLNMFLNVLGLQASFTDITELQD